jgi:hypothetical protein
MIPAFVFVVAEPCVLKDLVENAFRQTALVGTVRRRPVVHLCRVEKWGGRWDRTAVQRDVAS